MAIRLAALSNFYVAVTLVADLCRAAFGGLLWFRPTNISIFWSPDAIPMAAMLLNSALKTPSSGLKYEE